MATQLKLRRDTAANWTSVNPVLAQGEIGYETDTGNAKIGDGSSSWSVLLYSLIRDIKGALAAASPVCIPTAVVGGSVSASGKVTFGEVGSVSVQGVFTTRFAMYRIDYKAFASTVSTLRFRTRSGSTDSTTPWMTQSVFVSGGSMTAASQGSVEPWIIAGMSSGYWTSADISVKRVATGDPTAVRVVSTENVDQRTSTGSSTSPTVFDGFTLAVSTGTMTGTLNVTGYGAM